MENITENSEMSVANKTIVFHGVVLPERVDFNHPRISAITEEASFQIQIIKSKIFVEVKTGDMECNIYSLKNLVQEAVESVINIHCFKYSYGYDLEITSAFVLETCFPIVFGVDQPIFEGKTSPNLPDVTEKMINDPFLGFSMNDFRNAVKKPSLTSAYCRRSIEAIANAFGENEKYSKMQSTLNLDRAYIEKYKDIAHNLRHGKPLKEPLSWEEIKEQLLVTWEVIRRYMWHLSLGNLNRLSLKDFPLLNDINVIFLDDITE